MQDDRKSINDQLQDEIAIQSSFQEFRRNPSASSKEAARRIIEKHTFIFLEASEAKWAILKLLQQRPLDAHDILGHFQSQRIKLKNLPPVGVIRYLDDLESQGSISSSAFVKNGRSTLRYSITQDGRASLNDEMPAASNEVILNRLLLPDLS